MKAQQIDAFISTMIDEVTVTAHSDGVGVGNLLTDPTPVADDTELLAVLVIAARLRNFADTFLTRAAGAVERAGVPARRRDTVTSMLTSIGVPPVVAHRAVKVAVRNVPCRPSMPLPAMPACPESTPPRWSPGWGISPPGHRTSTLMTARSWCHTWWRKPFPVPRMTSPWARKTALELVPADAPTPVAENRELNEMSASVGDDGRTHAQLDLDALAGGRVAGGIGSLTTPTPEPYGSPDPRSAGSGLPDAFEQIAHTYCGGRTRRIAVASYRMSA